MSVCVCVVHKTPLGLCIIEGSSTFRMNENARFVSFRPSPARTIERFHRKEEKNPEENLGSVTKRQKKTCNLQGAVIRNFTINSSLCVHSTHIHTLSLPFVTLLRAGFCRFFVLFVNHKRKANLGLPCLYP